MRTEEIRINARKNSAKLEELKRVLREAGHIIFNDRDFKKDWRYVKQENLYTCYLDPLDVGTAFCQDYLAYDVIETEFEELHFKATFCSPANEYTIMAYINADVKSNSENINFLLERLNERRKCLYVKKMESIKENVKDYLIKHEAEYCTYPTLNAINGNSLITKTFTVWNGTRCNLDDEIISVLLSTINHSQSESLKGIEAYSPVFFDKGETSKEIHLGADIYLQLNMEQPADYEKAIFPEIKANFIIRNPLNNAISPAYSAALTAIEQNSRALGYSHFMSFCEDLEETDRWYEAKEGFVTYIPIIWKEYADEILRNAKKVYADLPYSFEKVKKEIPLFQDCSNELSICIKVTINN